MKLNDVKHNHSLTDLLKVLLFSIIMLLPFIDVAVRCGYVMLNKNAYQSYSGDIQETITNSYSLNELEYNEEYDLVPQQSTGTATIYGAYISYNKTNNTNINLEGYSSMYINGDNYIFQGNGLTNIYETYNTIVKISFTFYRYQSTNLNGLDDCFKQTIPTSNSKLDNVFEYSVSQLENSQLYNWTTQTAIYSGVSQMTTQLGITTNIIPIIVCYWFFITIIYIILDIVIRLFTMLTHAIGSKTA